MPSQVRGYYILLVLHLRAILALVLYEHLVTFRFEIDLLWRRKWSAVTLIYMINRYLLIANAILLSVVPYIAQVSVISLQRTPITDYKTYRCKFLAHVVIPYLR